MYLWIIMNMLYLACPVLVSRWSLFSSSPVHLDPAHESPLEDVWSLSLSFHFVHVSLSHFFMKTTCNVLTDQTTSNYFALKTWDQLHNYPPNLQHISCHFRLKWDAVLADENIFAGGKRQVEKKAKLDKFYIQSIKKTFIPLRREAG